MLNINQNKAVYANERFIFLLAGAGTGKTRVLLQRVFRMIHEGVLVNNILMITFTKKAAEELLERFHFKDKPLITTFHGFCYKMLSPYKKLNLVEESFLIDKGFSYDDIRLIDIHKRHQMVSKLVKKYERLLKKHNLIDFTDLEVLMIQHLKSNPSFKQRIGKMYKYVFIDEFQDTSWHQFNLIKLLKTNQSHFFVVGDPDQSIYGFRGASSQVIKQYIKYFKATKYKLDLNYRSSREIVQLSNKLIAHNPNRIDKRLESCINEKGYIHLRYFKNEAIQNSFILEELRRLHQAGIHYHDVAILYRNHYLGNGIKELLRDTYITTNLLSIHQSKGLEFKVVFIIGLNEGILPMGDVVEERRLFYVAITRSKRHLYILVNKEKPTSRFIRECF